ncbi:MAG: alpha/beta hydrolase [Oscillospiraceae bacterium]|nr:alpha/beta hydrolase [Oscillospiraceae bacterium]
MIALWILLAVLLFVALIAYICFRMAYYVPDKTKIRPEYEMPPGKIYEPYYDQMRKWMEEVRAMPSQDFSIRSFDGLTLWGKYYEYAPGAPIELMFHGYRGTAERDLCGGVQRSFSLGHSALIVDQRASCRSDGNVITFGAKESRDCLSWVDFMVKHFGSDVRIILCGISMGASTVLMASGEKLPKNVIGVLADCGFSSAKAIICKVIRQMKLPEKLLYPFVRLGGILYGGFDPNKADAAAAVKKCQVPVIFFHGDQDDYVPFEMSKFNYDACSAVKELVFTPGAGHGICYLVDQQAYIDALRKFEKNWGL